MIKDTRHKSHPMVLDLTKVKCQAIKERYHDNLLIPLVKGEYRYPYDVDESKCSPSFIYKHKYYAALLERRAGYRSKMKSWAVPIGISETFLPRGAVVRRANEGEL